MSSGDRLYSVSHAPQDPVAREGRGPSYLGTFLRARLGRDSMRRAFSRSAVSVAQAACSYMFKALTASLMRGASRTTASLRGADKTVCNNSSVVRTSWAAGGDAIQTRSSLNGTSSRALKTSAFVRVHAM